MAFGDFPENLYIKVLENTEENLGSFSPTVNNQLSEIVCTFYKHGTAGGSEQIRLNIHGDNDNETPIASSDWVTISDISGLGTYWLGWLRFDFSLPHINANSTYFVTSETQNYTRNGDTFFLGFTLDWPQTVNSPSGDIPPVDFQFYGFN